MIFSKTAACVAFAQSSTYAWTPEPSPARQSPAAGRPLRQFQGRRKRRDTIEDVLFEREHPRWASRKIRRRILPPPRRRSSLPPPRRRRNSSPPRLRRRRLFFFVVPAPPSPFSTLRLRVLRPGPERRSPQRRRRRRPRRPPTPPRSSRWLPSSSCPLRRLSRRLLRRLRRLSRSLLRRLLRLRRRLRLRRLAFALQPRPRLSAPCAPPYARTARTRRRRRRRPLPATPRPRAHAAACSSPRRLSTTCNQFSPTSTQKSRDATANSTRVSRVAPRAATIAPANAHVIVRVIDRTRVESPHIARRKATTASASDPATYPKLRGPASLRLSRAAIAFASTPGGAWRRPSRRPRRP